MDGSEKNDPGVPAPRTDSNAVFPDAVIAAEKTFMNPDEIASCFLPGGRVEAAFGDGYEFRKQQQSVTREIASAFNGDLISLLEAPTGTGKTLSYLVPSARWALLNGERVVISTNTINLQDQIINKDMPMLREILGEEVGYALVKGMRNYLCLLRAEDVKEESREMFPAESGAAEDGSGAGEEEEAVIEWAKRTSDGSVSDLGFAPSEETWDKFAAESESCIRKECPRYRDCFFFRARRKIAESKLIVVNHHLLFSDISIKDSAGKEDAGILPPNRRVVIDEAHNVADSATSHFSLRISTLAVLKTLNRLRRTVSRSSRLAGFLKREGGVSGDAPVLKLLSAMKKVFPPRIERVEAVSALFFDALRADAAEFAGKEGGETLNVRVAKGDVESGKRWGAAVSLCPEVRSGALDLSASVKEAVSILGEPGSGDAVAGVVAELRAVLSGLERLTEAAGRFADADAFAEFVKSVEVRGKGENPFTAVSISPVDIASQLRDKLYSKYGTVVMTSATLTAAGGFDFQKRCLGLEGNERLSELAVPSPFEYKKQALLALPSDLPEPGAGGVHSEKLSGAVLECVRASGGGALVLFTSYRMLKKVSSAVSPELARLGVRLLTQGSAPREKLLADFKSDKNSALFATDSFREGVDIAGDALRLVVVTRLPFRVPDEPVFQARMEAIEGGGGDAFGDYAVPMAVVGFRQAFGRLIRTATDRGAVVVLDSRIVRRGYGRRFIESVPKCRTVRGEFRGVVKRIGDFFAGEGEGV